MPAPAAEFNDVSNPLIKTQRPFQFSLATLMVAMTGYSVLFALLRAWGISTPAAFMTLLFFTTVAYSQWTLFDGRSPYSAAFLVGGGLFFLMFLAGLEPRLIRPLLALVFLLGSLVGGLIGVGVAGFWDFWLLISQAMRGVVPKPWESTQEMLHSPNDHSTRARAEPRRRLRLAVLCLLAATFFLGMVWGKMTGKEWLTSTVGDVGRLWRIP